MKKLKYIDVKNSYKCRFYDRKSLKGCLTKILSRINCLKEQPVILYTVVNSNTPIRQINVTLTTQVVKKVFFLDQKDEFMFIHLYNESESLFIRFLPFD